MRYVLLLVFAFCFSCCSSIQGTDESAFKYEYFFKYVNDSNYEKVKGELQKGFRVDQRNYAGRQAIHMAVVHRDVPMIELLLDFGADINARLRGGNTPLHIFQVFGLDHSDGDTFIFLIRHGADVNAKNMKGQTPLHLAAANGIFAWSSCLVQNGADVNARDNQGNTPLHMASKWGGRSRIVELLLDHGAELNLKGELYTTPLRLAILSGDEKTIRLLKERGARDFGIVPVSVHRFFRWLFFLR